MEHNRNKPKSVTKVYKLDESNTTNKSEIHFGMKQYVFLTYPRYLKILKVKYYTSGTTIENLQQLQFSNQHFTAIKNWNIFTQHYINIFQLQTNENVEHYLT